MPAKAGIQNSLTCINLLPLLKDCTLAINHANSGTTTAMLCAGISLLMLPMHLEQCLTAERVGSLGAGLLAHPEQPPPDYPQVLRHMFDNPVFTQRAQAFAKRYADCTQYRKIPAMVKRIDEIIADTGKKLG